jgi:hypothetical protein
MVEWVTFAFDRLIDRRKKPYHLGKFCSVEIQASAFFAFFLLESTPLEPDIIVNSSAGNE